MKLPKRKPASPMMSAMGQKVDHVGTKLVGSQEGLNHSFEIGIDQVQPDPGQARKHFDEGELKNLADSIAQYGLFSPILVRRNDSSVQNMAKWVIVAGERRWRAARMLKMPRILAIEFDDDEQVRIASLVENIQRQDLTPVEEALGLKELARIYHCSQRELARRVGRNLSEINGLLSVAALPESFLKEIEQSGKKVARNLLIELSRMPDSPQRKKLMGDILGKTVKIQDVRDWHSALKTSNGTVIGADGCAHEVSDINIELPSLLGKGSQKPVRASYGVDCGTETGQADPLRQARRPARFPSDIIRRINESLNRLEGVTLHESEREALYGLRKKIDALISEY